MLGNDCCVLELGLLIDNSLQSISTITVTVYVSTLHEPNLHQTLSNTTIMGQGKSGLIKSEWCGLNGNGLNRDGDPGFTAEELNCQNKICMCSYFTCRQHLNYNSLCSFF